MHPYHALLVDAKFHQLLQSCDEDLAAQARSVACTCGGRVHVANYPRKPRSALRDLPPRFGVRFSFCCSVDGCRARQTPPSVRFLGRRVFLSVMVVLVAALAQGATPPRVTTLRKALGVSRRTLVRWRRWWTEHFPQSTFWRAARGRFQTPVAPSDLPLALIDRFSGQTCESRALAAIRFLSPIGTRLAAAQVHAF